MIATAEQLEAQLEFEANKLKTARYILELSYALAEDGANEQQLVLLRNAAERTLHTELWDIESPMAPWDAPTYRAPAPTPYRA